MELSQALCDGIDRLLAAGRVEVRENGAWLAALDGFRYEVRGSGETSLLHLWSEDHNLLRRVVGIKDNSERRLALDVLAPGRTRPCEMELLVADAERRPRRAERERFLAQFRELLLQTFPDETPVALTTAANLKDSLSGNYARGLLTNGSRAWAVLAAAPGESAATYDALLTFGLLWLERASRPPNRRAISGLRLFFPRDAGRVTSHRLQALAPQMTVELYEYSTDNWRARRLDPRDSGNLETWLIPRRETESALSTAAGDIERVTKLAPEAIEPHSIPGTREIALRFRGLLFARWTPEGMFYGLGDAQQPLTPDRWSKLEQLVGELQTHRAPSATALLFVADATSQLGLGWCLGNTPPGASRSCTASASAAMSICVAC